MRVQGDPRLGPQKKIKAFLKKSQKTHQVSWQNIIETNTYAGNFNRELTAYVTGILGECKVGKGCIDKNFNYPLEFNEKIEQVRDDYGTYRPCDVHEYYSVIIFFNDEPLYSSFLSMGK